MAYSYRIEANDEIIVWVDKDGRQVMRQPHHPQAYMNAPWSSIEEAETWADAKVAELEAEEQAIANQQNKLDRILQLLEQNQA